MCILIFIYFSSLSFHRRQWHPTPVLLPGKSHGWRSLVGCSPWCRNWATSLSLSLSTFIYSRRKYQPTPVFLPGESQGLRNLVGCRLWGHTESAATKWLSSSSSSSSSSSLSFALAPFSSLLAEIAQAPSFAWNLALFSSLLHLLNSYLSLQFLSHLRQVLPDF